MMSSFQLPVIALPTKTNPKKHTIIDKHLYKPNTPRYEIRKPINLNIGPFTIIFYHTERQPEPHPKNMYTKNTKNFDRLNFILDYFDIDWDAILQANKDDVNLSMQIFMNKVNRLLDKYMPLRKLTHKKYKRHFKPWITDLLLDSFQKVYELQR